MGGVLFGEKCVSFLFVSFDIIFLPWLLPEARIPVVGFAAAASIESHLSRSRSRSRSRVGVDGLLNVPTEFLPPPPPMPDASTGKDSPRAIAVAADEEGVEEDKELEAELAPRPPRCPMPRPPIARLTRLPTDPPNAAPRPPKGPPWP